MTAWQIHPAARHELIEVLSYYLTIDPELAHAFDDHYRRYRTQICETPLLHNARRNQIRRVNLTPRFGEYYIAYMLWKHEVVILAIAHAKRRPGYWRQRISESKQIF
ncbi:hypothetical protein FEM03_21245 [Phragmitibacter flavus]|uniref:Type II toxin-antitoxin system RelE/ParE family toxin n=1 Tax=Phragmitibacter flavus TaxID=2576071 RepID=A0A5R8K8U4_9BACT|nr:type II toxin-antitoxin system RelE/ParE family toxin [Phragmitibacter flavus]TLD68710.1 hypothetical protein FEM03_21245 [Phragmitibacter flavus]